MGIGSGGSGQNSISGSSDVILNNPATNQVLGYDGSLSKWKNIPNVGGSTPTISTKSATWNIASSDGDIVDYVGSSDVSATLNTSVATNTLQEITQLDTGVVTIVAGAGVTLLTPDGGAKTSGRGTSVFIRSLGGTPVATTPPTPGMLARFKADSISGANGSSVSSWSDSSSNNVTSIAQATTANQPILVVNANNSGHKAVNFDANQKFMTFSGSALNLFRNRTKFTVSFALNYTFIPTAGDRTLLAFSTGTTAGSSRVYFNSRELTSGNVSAGGRRLDTDSANSVTGTLNEQDLGPTIYTLEVDYSTTTLSVYVNGQLAGTNTSFLTNGSSSDTASLAGVLGGNLAQNNAWLQAQVFEFLVYNDVSSSLRQTIHGYYANEYSITLDGSSAYTAIVRGGVA